MKKISLIALFIIPISLFAQGDDYCPCQDELKNQAEIFDFVSSVNTQLYVQVREEVVSAFTPVTIPEEAPVFIVLPAEKPAEVSPPDEVDREELRAEIQARNEARASKFKKAKKRPKAKVKRKKRIKKYKGKCPFS